MRLRTIAALGSVTLAFAAVVAAGCNAGNKSGKLTPTGTGGDANTGGDATGGVIQQGGAGGTIFTNPTGGSGGTIGTGGSDPCTPSECGPTELCDPDHLGLDDDCDGQVDEICPCQTGLTHWCFKGNPAKLNGEGCFPGTQSCTELGTWSECLGGVHADQCGVAQAGCHPISSAPFVTVNLASGVGSFNQGALAESWTVQCPAGVSPCPAVGGANPADDFQPIVSGEYQVTYTKTTANGPATCDYPLFVGAPGLRVELDWEHDLGGTGVDLDLHVHKPGTTEVWTGNGGNPAVCAWDNCKYYDFQPPFPLGPDWFSGVAPPNPVDWYLDPVFENNTCYFAPRGVGTQWQNIGLGCHNPRLDLDNITCTPTIVDPNNSSFCAPENINIDYPPNDKWTRIGVHYYGSHGVSYNVHPRVRIFCNGQQAADLGPLGYASPVTFAPADSSTRFWIVADVRFVASQCAATQCEVHPHFADPNAQTPYLSTVTQVQASFGPPYPP